MCLMSFIPLQFLSSLSHLGSWESLQSASQVVRHDPGGCFVEFQDVPGSSFSVSGLESAICLRSPGFRIRFTHSCHVLVFRLSYLCQDGDSCPLVLTRKKSKARWRQVTLVVQCTGTYGMELWQGRDPSGNQHFQLCRT